MAIDIFTKLLLKFKTKNGFTLIEILVVMGAFALVIGGSTTLLMMILRNNQKTEVILAISQEGGSAVSYINKKLTGAVKLN
jgi:prepilin-type N-terminal cleavage/methylation domain-containing protein